MNFEQGSPVLLNWAVFSAESLLRVGLCVFSFLREGGVLATPRGVGDGVTPGGAQENLWCCASNLGFLLTKCAR